MQRLPHPYLPIPRGQPQPMSKSLSFSMTGLPDLLRVVSQVDVKVRVQGRGRF